MRQPKCSHRHEDGPDLANLSLKWQDFGERLQYCRLDHLSTSKSEGWKSLYTSDEVFPNPHELASLVAQARADLTGLDVVAYNMC